MLKIQQKVHQMPQIALIVPVISQIHLPSMPSTLAVATSLPSTLVAASLACIRAACPPAPSLMKGAEGCVSSICSFADVSLICSWG